MSSVGDEKEEKRILTKAEGSVIIYIMINIAVVEDDGSAADLLCEHIRRYSEEHGKACEVVRFSDASSFLSGHKNAYDVVFMDIGLPGKDGMTAAEELRRSDGEVVIVFCTSMAQFALKGYSVKALDYIVKPADYMTFSVTFERALRVVERGRSRDVVVNTANGMECISPSDITYVEIYDHRLMYHLGDKTVESWGSLKKLSAELGDDFVLCNSCYLINLRFVEEISGGSVTVGGDVLNMSRAGAKAVMTALARHID